MSDHQAFKELIDYSLDEMPADSMSKNEREKIRVSMYDKLEKGQIRGPGDIMEEFDRIEKEGQR